RALLMDRLGQALTRAPWHSRVVAVVFCDLDGFKVVNDSLGHTAGDQLLQLVANRLTDHVRDGDTVARLGGDEFVIVLADIAKADDVEGVAQQLTEVLLQPFEIEQQEIIVTASIGISLFPHDGNDAGVLLKNADAAMYRAKDQGRNTYKLYSPAMTAHASARLSLEQSLRRALERQEFRLHYQPIIDLRSGDLIGAEALLRWEHSELGVVGPAEFLPLVEENGLIVPIGEWVLGTACAQNKAWQQIPLPPISVAVNLSNRQFHQANLLELIRRVLSDTSLAPGQLELELTENIVMKDPEGAIETLCELRAMGVRLAIDDFGTGYSSLAYLKRFPLNVVKIDRSFVKDIMIDADDAAITGAIVAMAHKMNIQVVAEGVETPQQMAILREQECDYMQGYLVSRPMAAEAFTQFFQDWHNNNDALSAVVSALALDSGTFSE
ncbi:MAG: putative bifunctional diguanylate cyclase/phosphodiesterase, partial [Methyloligellaceae bacterium]